MDIVWPNRIIAPVCITHARLCTSLIPSTTLIRLFNLEPVAVSDVKVTLRLLWTFLNLVCSSVLNLFLGRHLSAKDTEYTILSHSESSVLSILLPLVLDVLNTLCLPLFNPSLCFLLSAFLSPFPVL